MDKYAIIVAGGSGTRLGSSIPKQFLLLRDKPVLWYTMAAFVNAFNDITLILVLPEQHQEKGHSLIGSFINHKILVTTGGTTRYQSVENGLKLVPENALVFIHDGVRCLLTSALINRCYNAAILNGNAVPAIPAVDTIRIETSSGSEMIDRTKVRIIQTPKPSSAVRLSTHSVRATMSHLQMKPVLLRRRVKKFTW